MADTLCVQRAVRSIYLVPQMLQDFAMENKGKIKGTEQNKRAPIRKHSSRICNNVCKQKSHPRMEEIRQQKVCLMPTITAYLQITALLSEYFRSIKFLLLLLQSALQPIVGFWPAQLSLSLLSRKGFYRVLLPAARQTPNLEDQ